MKPPSRKHFPLLRGLQMSWLDVWDGERADCNFLGSVSEIKSAQENRHCLDTSLLSSQCIINMSCVTLSHGAAQNALSLLPASAEQSNPFSLIHSQPCWCPNVKNVNAKLQRVFQICSNMVVHASC